MASVESLLQQGHAYLDQKQHLAALESFQQALALAPQ